MLQEFAEKNLNIVSDTVKSYLNSIQLKPGQMVKYRLLNGTPNIDPQRKKGDDMLYPSCVAISLQEKIKDPEGGIKQVGLVKAFDDNERPIFVDFILTPQKGDGGFFFLSGDRVADIEMYDIIELKNNNKSNPYRDISVTPIFERVNEAAESKVRSKKRNYLFDSLDAIRHWTPEEMRFAGASNGLSSALEIDVLKDKLEEIAERDPETFYKSIESEDNKLKAIIKLATEAGFISFNAHEYKWIDKNGETVALLDRREGENEVTGLLQFLKTSVNGPAIQGKLEKLLKSKKPQS